MKKSLIFLIFIILVSILLCGCGESQNTNANQSEKYVEETENKVLTEEDVKQIAATELYYKISGFALAYNAKAENTQYSITSIQHFDGFYIVKGVYTLYDAYGKYVGYMKKNEAFEVRVSESGSATVTKCGY